MLCGLARSGAFTLHSARMAMPPYHQGMAWHCACAPAINESEGRSRSICRCRLSAKRSISCCRPVFMLAKWRGACSRPSGEIEGEDGARWLASGGVSWRAALHQPPGMLASCAVYIVAYDASPQCRRRENGMCDTLSCHNDTTRWLWLMAGNSG